MREQKKWHCTIFIKKKNKPIKTIETMWEFSEKHGKAFWIMKGLAWEIDKKVSEHLLEFLLYKIDEVDKKHDSLFEKFDEDYRILIS